MKTLHPRGDLGQVNYKDFCAVVDPINPDITLAEKQGTAAFIRGAASTYFDKSGGVIPVQ